MVRWSPVGPRFAYLGRDAVGPAIFLTNIRSAASVRNLTGAADATPDPDFVWTPDGNWILYTATTPNGRRVILRVRIEPQGTPQVLTPLSLDSKHPSVSPDGLRFVYSSSSPSAVNAFDLYTNNIDGTNRTLLHATPGVDDVLPVWGPDGRIVYVRAPSDLYLIESNQSHHDIGDYAGLGSPNRPDTPAWSPNGRFIAYSGGGGKIYIVGTAAPYDNRCITCQRDVGGGLNIDQNPRWEDDNRLVFDRPVHHIPPLSNPEGIFRINRDGTGETYLNVNADWPDPRRDLTTCGR